MKNRKRPFAAALAAILLASAVPARASSDAATFLFGLFGIVLGTLGYVAYQTDTGKDFKPYHAPDQTDRDKKKDGARIEIVPPPTRDDEARPAELAAGIALCKKF